MRFFDRLLRLVPKYRPEWCDEEGMMELLKLQTAVRNEYRALEESIKARVNALRLAIYRRTHSPNDELKNAGPRTPDVRES